MHSSVLAMIVLLPWLSAVASYVGSRDVLIGIYFLIGLTVFTVVMKGGPKCSDRYFMLLVWSISSSLLLSSVLISDNLRGFDIHGEYAAFRQVSRLGRWNLGADALYNSVASVTIFPLIITSISDLDGITVFRVLFPLIYSVLPVLLYKIYIKFLSPRAAFLSVFLFMSVDTFYIELPAIGREQIAELLLVVLVLVLMSTNISERISGRLAIVVLTVGLVMAHYSIAYLYLFFLGCSLVMSRLFRRKVALWTSTTALITLVATLAWYATVARGAAVLGLSKSMSRVIEAVATDFFGPGTRPVAVLQAVGFIGLPGILHDINRATAYLVQVFLVLGFFAVTLKKRKSETENKILPLMTGALILLGASTLLPLFSTTLNLSRLYHIVLLFLSPCFFYGVEQLSRTVGSTFRNLAHIHIRFDVRWVLAAMILFSYFLYGTGLVWAVGMDRPTSVIIDSERMLNSRDPALEQRYFNDRTITSDIAAARWLSRYYTGRLICADLIARAHVLTSYGEFGSEDLCALPYDCNFSNSFVYLTEVNTIYGWGQATMKERFPISKISTSLATKDIVCSVGVATIYA
jgi:uncharacterized membrane protein